MADTDENADPDDHPDDGEPASQREARYRIRAREAEAERDQLRANVEALQRSEVERIAGQYLRKPGALWAADTELADLLDDDGNVDPAKVDAAAQSAAETLGLPRPPRPDHNQGRNLGSPPTADVWREAFNPG